MLPSASLFHRLVPSRKFTTENPIDFLRTDFRFDQWLCRLCDRFDPSPTGKPTFYRKRKAIEHEGSPEHQRSIELFRKYLENLPAQAQKYSDRMKGWEPQGDSLFPDEVYNNLMWHTPDVRNGVDYVNRFVTFWIEDVAAAQGEVDEEESPQTVQSKGRSLREKRRTRGAQVEVPVRHTRQTFEQFFDSLEFPSEKWDAAFDGAYGEDGWGTPAVPGANANKGETTKKRKNEPDAEGWVVQKAGKRKWKGKGKGQVERKPSSSGKGGDSPIIGRNLFAQVGACFQAMTTLLTVPMQLQVDDGNDEV